MARYSKLALEQRAAHRAINKVLRLGSPRHGNKNDGFIHSTGTARQYRQTYKLVYRYCKANGENLRNLSTDTAKRYLEYRAEKIQQKQLNNERSALNKYLSAIHKKPVELTFTLSHRKTSKPVNRAYSHEQVKQLIYAANEKGNHRLATSIALAYTAGLRVEELYTLAPPGEKNPSSHRQWSPDRFAGREHWVSGTVTGKGGLTREVRFTDEINRILEDNYKREQSIDVIDKNRETLYETHYDLLAGKKFSDKFSALSQSTFGWSNGAHGLRHSYAQRRDIELKNLFDHETSRLILTQELGHFDTSNLRYYLI